MALNVLPKERWLELRAQFDRVEGARMGPARRAEYLRLVERLEAAYPDPEPARPAGRCH